MLNFSLLILFPALIFAYSSSRIYVCQNALDCASSEYKSPWFDCEGYKSCANSQLKSTSYISCDSKYSCQGANLWASDDVYCDGVHSCYGLQLKKAQNLWCANDYSCSEGVVEVRGNIYCEGDYACAKGNYVLSKPKGSLIHLRGDYSGQSSDFTFADGSSDIQYMYVEGYNALYYGNLYSGAGNTVHYYFRGFRSAAYIGVYCQSGSTCNINCFGYACLNTMVFCANDAKCNYACYNTKNMDYCAMEKPLDYEVTDEIKAENGQRALMSNGDEVGNDDVTEQDHLNMKINMGDTEYKIYSQIRENKEEAARRKSRKTLASSDAQDDDEHEDYKDDDENVESLKTNHRSKKKKLGIPKGVAGPEAKLNDYNIKSNHSSKLIIILVSIAFSVVCSAAFCICCAKNDDYEKL